MKTRYRIVHDGSVMFPYKVQYKNCWFCFWSTFYDMREYMFRTPEAAENELKRFLQNKPPEPHVVKYIDDL